MVAVEKGVDAVIHTSDLLGHDVYSGTLDVAASSLHNVAYCGIPVYRILGTRDHNSANPQLAGPIGGRG
jgi:hypothetical protein